MANMQNKAKVTKIPLLVLYFFSFLIYILFFNLRTNFKGNLILRRSMTHKCNVLIRMNFFVCIPHSNKGRRGKNWGHSKRKVVSVFDVFIIVWILFLFMTLTKIFLLSSFANRFMIEKTLPLSDDTFKQAKISNEKTSMETKSTSLQYVFLIV